MRTLKAPLSDGCRLKTLLEVAPAFVSLVLSAVPGAVFSLPGLGDAVSVSSPSRRALLVGARLASVATQRCASASHRCGDGFASYLQPKPVPSCDPALCPATICEYGSVSPAPRWRPGPPTLVALLHRPSLGRDR